jgi:hypothetical protein
MESSPSGALPTYVDFGMVYRWLHLDRGEIVPEDRLGVMLEGFRLMETLVLHETIVIPTPRPYGAWIRADPLLAPFVEAGHVVLERSDALEAAFRLIVESHRDRSLFQKAMDRVADKIPESDRELVSRLNGESQGLIENLNMFLTTLAQSIWRSRSFIPGRIRYSTLAEKVVDQILASARAKGPSEKAQHIRATHEVARQRLALFRAAREDLSMLEKSYRELSTHTAEELLSLRRLGRPVPVVIPPIPAIALDASASKDALGRSLLSLRHDLTSARAAITEYESVVTDDQLPIRDSVDAARKLQDAMDRLLRGDQHRPLIAVGDWATSLLGAARELADGATRGGMLGAASALVGQPLRIADAAVRRREVMYFAILRERFQDIRGYAALAPRVLNVEVNERNWAESVELLSFGETFVPPNWMELVLR